MNCSEGTGPKAAPVLARKGGEHHMANDLVRSNLRVCPGRGSSPCDLGLQLEMELMLIGDAKAGRGD
jgi:hypothetical protein